MTQASNPLEREIITVRLQLTRVTLAQLRKDAARERRTIPAQLAWMVERAIVHRIEPGEIAREQAELRKAIRDIRQPALPPGRDSRGPR